MPVMLRPIKFKKKIQQSLTILLVLVSLIPLNLFGWVAYWFIRNQLDEQLNHKMRSAAALASQSLETEWFRSLSRPSRITANIISNISTIRDAMSMRNILIINKDGEVYLDANGFYPIGKRYKNPSFQIEDLRSALKSREMESYSGLTRIRDGGQFRSVRNYFRVILDGSKPTRYLLAIESVADYADMLVRFRDYLVWAAALTSLIAIVLALLMARQMTRPIIELASASEQVAQGNFNIVVPLSAKNEIGMLTHHFNKMVQRLKSHNDFMLESMSNGFIAMDMNGSITTFNKAAETILHLRKASVIGRRIDSALARYSPLLALCKNALSHGQYAYGNQMEIPWQKSLLSLHVNVSPLVNDQGKRIGAEVYFADYSQIKSLQVKIAEKERLATLGEFSAAVAHEVRNPLAVIEGLIDLIESKTDTAAIRNYTGTIRNEVKVLNRLVTDFLLFARPARVELSTVDIQELVNSSILNVERETRNKSIQFKTIFHGPKTIMADQPQLRRCLVNILLNSIQSIDKHGVIKITVSTKLAQNNHQSNNSGDPRWCIITISDTGKGILRSDISKVFDPFFTTKANGTGMGLAITKTSILNHGGSIEISSRPGHGTTISMNIPDRRKAN